MVKRIALFFFLLMIINQINMLSYDGVVSTLLMCGSLFVISSFFVFKKANLGKVIILSEDEKIEEIMKSVSLFWKDKLDRNITIQVLNDKNIDCFVDLSINTIFISKYFFLKEYVNNIIAHEIGHVLFNEKYNRLKYGVKLIFISFIIYT